MPNDMRNEMEIELLGETLLLRPTFEGICEMESVAELGVQGISTNLVRENASIKILAAVIWGGLVGAENKKYTLKQVKDMVVEHGAYELLPQAIMFMHKAMQGNREQAKKKSAQAKN